MPDFAICNRSITCLAAGIKLSLLGSASLGTVCKGVALTSAAQQSSPFIFGDVAKLFGLDVFLCGKVIFGKVILPGGE